MATRRGVSLGVGRGRGRVRSCHHGAARRGVLGILPTSRLRRATPAGHPGHNSPALGAPSGKLRPSHPTQSGSYTGLASSHGVAGGRTFALARGESDVAPVRPIPLDRRRAVMWLPSGRDGGHGAGGVLPPVDFGQPLGDIGPFRIQRPRLLEGGGRVGELPRRETGIPAQKGLVREGLRGAVLGRQGGDRRAPGGPTGSTRTSRHLR